MAEISDEAVEAVAKDLARNLSLNWDLLDEDDDNPIDPVWCRHALRVMAKSALTAAAPFMGPKWEPTHRHVKGGSTYKRLGTAFLQASEPVGEAAALIIYQGRNGQLWARPETEFDDGRFEAISTPPESQS